jgi:hypothetical protein
MGKAIGPMFATLTEAGLRTRTRPPLDENTAGFVPSDKGHARADTLAMPSIGMHQEN